MKRLFVIFVCLLLSVSCEAADIEIWNRISLEDTDKQSLDGTVRKIWHVFERAAIDRGLIVKPNYKPFEPESYISVLFDTPLGELSYHGYGLRATSNNEGIENVSFYRISEEGAGELNQVGYFRGRLGEELTYSVSADKKLSDKLRAFDRMRLEAFNSTEVPVEDAVFFFPQISALRLRFNNLYPKDDVPNKQVVFSPGMVHFGAILGTDIFISYWHDLASDRMVWGEISWKTSIGEFVTGEEVGLAQAFFFYMQEMLSKAGMIVPARKPF